MAHLAAHLLGTRLGAKALLKYWENIGFGMTHAASFKAEFGMTVAEFGAKFEELRTDFGKAKNYADGAD